ncbi:MAG: sulfite exporter TauE/SafE family protein [Proteobacteria bacterium]|nr:sulfite exporter TauE/SafE family protein [Pseudomonadota bacterium]
MFAEFDFWIIVWCFFALCCGGFIKGALGVGTPLLTVPMMAMVVPPQTAIAIMAIPVVVANLWQFSQAERSISVVKRFWPALVGILVGTWIGVKILSTIDEHTLLILVGIAVITFALLQGSSYHFFIPETKVKPAGAIFGLSSGLIGGISSFFGPMLMVYLLSIRDLPKNQFVSTISFLYVSAVIPWAISLYLFGILDQTILIYSIAATLPVGLALLVGQKFRARISEEKFKILIIGILLVSGASMLWRAFL